MASAITTLAFGGKREDGKLHMHDEPQTGMIHERVALTLMEKSGVALWRRG